MKKIPGTSTRITGPAAQAGMRTHVGPGRKRRGAAVGNQVLQAERSVARVTPASRGAAKAKTAMSGPPSERKALVPGGPRIDVYDTPAAHQAAREMGMLGFSYAGRVFLGDGHKLPGAPSRHEILRHEMVHAAQSRTPGPTQSRGALEHQAHTWDGRAPLLSADPGAVYGWLWIPAVIAGGYILLKPNVANAPAPGDPTVASMTMGDYGKMIGEAVVLSSGGAVYGALRAAGFTAVTAWGASGAVGSMSFRGISDAHAGTFSGVDTYVVDGFTGATIGVVVGGTFHLIGRIPGRTQAISEWFRKGAEQDAAYAQLSARNKLIFEIGQKTLPNGQHKPLEALEPFERGARLIKEKGWLRAFLPSSTKFMIAGEKGTLLTGPTPGGRAALRSLFGFSSGFGGNAMFGDMIHDAYQPYGLQEAQTAFPDRGTQSQMQGAAGTIIVVPQGREMEWMLKNNKLGDFPIPRDAPGIRSTVPQLTPGTDVRPVRGSGIDAELPASDTTTAMG